MPSKAFAAAKPVLTMRHLAANRSCRGPMKIEMRFPDSKYAAQYKDKLTPQQYNVAYKDATERPFSNEFHDSKARGLYKSIASGEALFTSDDKFDSGTGWPSFARPVEASAVQEITDKSIPFMPRVEVRCAADEVHLGHVFPDGPKSKGGMRYCINSASLQFVPFESLT